MEPVYNYTKRCDYCGEEIAAFERRCPFCASVLEPVNYNPNVYYNPNTRFQQQNFYGMPGYPPVNPVYTPNQVPEQIPFQQPQHVSFQQSQQAPFQYFQQVPFQQSPQTGAEQMQDSGHVSGDKTEDDRNCAQTISGDSPVTSADAQHMAGKMNVGEHKLGNKFKVFITALCSAIPGLGQLIGLIISIVFISRESEDDKSFGAALMAVSLVVFVFQCLLYFIIILAFSPYSF